MNPTAFKSIRARLGMTQASIAEAIGVTQGNVSFYEKGQTVPPAVGRLLVDLARSRGLLIDFNHLYGEADLPPELVAAAGQAAPQPTAQA